MSLKFALRCCGPLLICFPWPLPCPGCLKNVLVVWGGIAQGDVVTPRELQVGHAVCAGGRVAGGGGRSGVHKHCGFSTCCAAVVCVSTIQRSPLPPSLPPSLAHCNGRATLSPWPASCCSRRPAGMRRHGGWASQTTAPALARSAANRRPCALAGGAGSLASCHLVTVTCNVCLPHPSRLVRRRCDTHDPTLTHPNFILLALIFLPACYAGVAKRQHPVQVATPSSVEQPVLHPSSCERRRDRAAR